MSMNVVRVRHMGMRVLPRLVPVAGAVFACRHGIVGVLVMPVVVAVACACSSASCACSWPWDSAK